MAVRLIDRDKGFAAMMRRVHEAKNARIKVGVLGDTEEPGGLTVGQVATIQEFGTEDGTIPARPFVRSTFDRERDHLVDMSRELMKKVVDGKIGITGALDVLGMYLANAMKSTITRGVPPPNAMSTLIAKARMSKSFRPSARTLGQAIGNAGILTAVKPLIDTGRMLNAITWAITSGEE